MKNMKKGAAALTTFIVSLIILLLLVGVIYVVTRQKGPGNQLPGKEQATSTPTQQASTTPTTTITDDPTNSNLKIYANATLGFSFSYPRDFVVKTEGFSTTTGTWTLELESGRGTILAHVAKTYISGETKLQNETITIGAKPATVYNTRRDTCDARVAQTELDSEYKLQLSFESCGSTPHAIYSSTDESNALLNSVKFTNENSRLYINTQLGEAYRYPITWTRPTETKSETRTVTTFGKDLTIVSGSQYSAGLKRNLTLSEVVTGALTVGSTTDQQMTVAGKPAHLLVTTPPSGAKLRTYYIENKNPNDMVIITQKGVDSEGLDLVISSFSFF